MNSQPVIEQAPLFSPTAVPKTEHRAISRLFRLERPNWLPENLWPSQTRALEEDSEDRGLRPKISSQAYEMNQPIETKAET